MGGDKPDNNLKVLDIRESASVRSRFGNRDLKNPLKYAEFGFNTANEAEITNDTTENIKVEHNELVNGSTGKDVEMQDNANSFPKPASGGAAKKFLKKKKKKKKQF